MIGSARKHPLSNMPANRLKSALGGLVLIVSACTGQGSGPVAPASGSGVARANTTVASEFMSLLFETENGTRIPRLLRYEGPVRVALDPALAAYRNDLEKVLAALRSQSGIDIAQGNGAAQIRIQQVPAASLRRAYPTAACVVVPGVSSFSQFMRGDYPRWSRQKALTGASVFIPDSAAPYIIRACLNEEIAQALGPVNDLYRVPSTVFNDDNVHNALTDYDFLILKALYSDALQTGMSPAAVQSRLPALFARLNPAGNRNGGAVAREDRRWKTLIETAMNSTNPRPARISAAVKAVARARTLNDQRLIHALIIYGRLTLRSQPEIAAPAFQEAYALAQSQLGPRDLRTALAGMHMAAVAMEAGRFDEVITFSTPALATARRFNDPVMLAGLQGMRALAFHKLGQNRASEAARLDSLAQARYAFGENAVQIAAAQEQIEGLLPTQ